MGTGQQIIRTRTISRRMLGSARISSSWKITSSSEVIAQFVYANFIADNSLATIEMWQLAVSISLTFSPFGLPRALHSIAAFVGVCYCMLLYFGLLLAAWAGDIQVF